MAPYEDRVRALAETVTTLRDDQLNRIEWIVAALVRPIEALRLETSDLVSAGLLNEFGDILKMHHAGSSEPFTKDKFEYALVTSSIHCGRKAFKNPRGNAGADVVIDGVRYSLKTQADKGIKSHVLHISKFMELGKGEWDLPVLRDRFLHHMEGYDRICSLRAFNEGANWTYELVEIPKALFLKAAKGELTICDDSRQTPKPGYCTVTEKDAVLFRLYFDGGTERKLQIKDIAKNRCVVHAEWKFKL